MPTSAERPPASVTSEAMTAPQQVRAAAVVRVDDHVLLHRARWDAFWALPGGRAEPLEPAAAAVRRELDEEIGASAEVGRLLWVVENFFTYDGLTYHEIAFCFLVAVTGGPGADPSVGSFLGHEPHVALEYRWFSLGELSDLAIRPAFLREELAALPSQPQHVVVDDTDRARAERADPIVHRRRPAATGLDGVRLRHATAADAPRLVRLLDVLGYPSHAGAIRRRLQAVLAEPQRATLVAEEAGSAARRLC